ncbi:unnamed protein product [Menidia menidia]|uniref:(Atlantic silverside) hypothetical protein n=1 Tax=Menidia menidia TaxID=238744 RepID=A0A8S4BN75_9TELE|nr:unnamed protein product [Menidia menidia]
MRRKAQVGNAENGIKSGENAHLGLAKRTGKLAKTPTGKGLGKAGAKRLGRLLKRAIQPKEEPKGQKKVSLPNTPVRLFKHQIQSEANNAPKTNSPKQASPQVSRLILSVVSKCKHRGGISMAELKQTLATEGYDVAKNNRQVNVVTKRLTNNETLVRTTRSTTFRLNDKKVTDTTQPKTKAGKSPKPKGKVKPTSATHKPPKGAERSKKTHKKTHTERARLHKPKGKTRKPAAKSHKSKKHKSKSRQKVVRKKQRPAKKRATRARKAQRKAKSTRRRKAKQGRCPYKSSPKRQPQRRRSPKKRAK